MRSPVTPETALKVIRTWAAFELDNPGVDALVPEHVLKLCDEALGIVPEPRAQCVTNWAARAPAPPSLTARRADER